MSALIYIETSVPSFYHETRTERGLLSRRIEKVFAEIAEARAAKKTAKAKHSKTKPTKKKAAK